MEDNDDVDRPTEKGQKRVAKHDSGAADLEKVTDYAEEREVFSQDISRVLFLGKFVSFTYSLSNVCLILFSLCCFLTAGDQLD